MDAVLLTGGLGTGKTTVAIQVGEFVEAAGVAGAVIDLDWFCWAWSPGLDVHALLCANLRSMLPNLRASGIERLVLARAVIGPDDVAQLRDALDDMPLQVVRLTVDRPEADRRLRTRDTGAVLDEHLRELASFEQMVAAATPNAPVVDTTGRTPSEVARDVMTAVGYY